MKKFLLALFISFLPSLSLADDEMNFDGLDLKYLDLAFDRYIKHKAETRYPFLLKKENYHFTLNYKNESVSVKISFKAKEFQKKTGRTIFGGGALVMVDLKSEKISSFTPIR